MRPAGRGHWVGDATAPVHVDAMTDRPPIGEPHLTDAHGLPPPPIITRSSVNTGYAIRNSVMRWSAAQSWFTPGRPISGVYPHGYQLPN